MRIVDLDDDAHVFCGEDGEYEKWNIDTSKTIEAKSVRPVEWRIWHIFYEDCDGWYAECPNCGERYPAIDVTSWNYCPHCGARMDEE